MTAQAQETYLDADASLRRLQTQVGEAADWIAQIDTGFRLFQQFIQQVGTAADLVRLAAELEGGPLSDQGDWSIRLLKVGQLIILELGHDRQPRLAVTLRAVVDHQLRSGHPAFRDLNALELHPPVGRIWVPLPHQSSDHNTSEKEAR